MHPVARVRHVFARRPWLYWALVVALASGAALAVASVVVGVDEARRSWGSTRQVVVATAALAPGQPLDGHTNVVAWPAPMVPEQALARAPPAAVARQHVGRGELLVEADVVAGTSPAALIPQGWRGVPVSEAVPSAAAVGDRVAAASGGVIISNDGIVVGRHEQAVIVAVPEPEAAAVAHSASAGDLILLLLP